MKKVIFIGLVLMPLIIKAQPVPIPKRATYISHEDSLKQIQRIIDVSDVSKEELYIIVADWIQKFSTITTYQGKIALLEDNLNCIKGEYLSQFRYRMKWYWVRQSIVFEIKDNMIRVTIKDLLVSDRAKITEKWEEPIRYDHALEWIRNNWRQNIASLEKWCLVDYRKLEEEARKNALFQ